MYHGMVFAGGLIVVLTCMGCGDDAESQSTDGQTPAVTDGDSSANTPADSAVAADAPTVLGIDAAMQQDIRELIDQFIKSQQPPGDPAALQEQAFTSAMDRVRRVGNEFGFEPDADGNLVWPQQMEEEIIAPLKEAYDANTFFEQYDVSLPPWAEPLGDEYEAGTITPERRQLLYHLAVAEVALRMA